MFEKETSLRKGRTRNSLQLQPEQPLYSNLMSNQCQNRNLSHQCSVILHMKARLLMQSMHKSKLEIEAQVNTITGWNYKGSRIS